MTTNMSAESFEVYDNFQFHHLSWNICVDIWTDGTKAMVGKIHGALQQNELVITVVFTTTHLQRKKKGAGGEASFT